MTIKLASNRFENVEGPAHDDMLGVLVTGLSGASQWNVKNIRDSLIPAGFLRNNSNDFASIKIQSPHWRKQGVPLDSIHIHYILDSAATAGQTVVFNTYWTWVTPGQEVPALVDWESDAYTLTFDANRAAWYYGITSVVPSPSAPLVEGYGLYLLCRIVRGNGTWAGEICILDMDSHAQKDRLGSINEASDS
jgi:hypothetical protein